MSFLTIKANGHFKRRLLTIRAVILFFVVWLVCDRFYPDNKEFAPLLGILCSFCSFITHPLQGFCKIWFPRFVLVLGAPVCLLAVEILNNTNPFDALSVTQCFFNLVWYYLVFGLLTIFLGRIRIACVISTLFFTIIGIINHYVLSFRGRVIFPCDIFSWQTALNVSEGFDFTPDKTMLGACLFSCAYLILVFCLPHEPKAKRPKKRISLTICTLSIVYMSLFFGTDMMKSFGIYSQQWKTQSNGFVLNFTVSLRYSIVTAPENYSDKAVLNIIENTPNVNSDNNPQPVHIIAIMNESFADFSEYNVPYSADPTPFLHSLSENTIKGTMYSPVTGGGTANVEFEFLTGNSICFLPANSVAYQLYLKDNTPSLVSQLKSLGYSSVAYHPYKSSGWNRTSVYNWLGFDKQMYQQDTIDPYYIRGYISDQSDYENLYYLTDNAGNEPLFIFNVTMQNHSGYRVPWTNLDKTIWLTGDMENLYSDADQFFSLMRESDNALRNLISHYSNTDVPTMIIFFGDHQPPLTNSFYEKITNVSMNNRTTEEVLKQYTTPFFIWTNYDIPEQEDIILSPWGLGVLAMKTAGIELTGYQEFLYSLMEELPVITPAGCITSDGTVIGKDDAFPSFQYYSFYNKYDFLIHNFLFDDDRQDEFFFLN